MKVLVPTVVVSLRFFEWFAGDSRTFSSSHDYETFDSELAESSLPPPPPALSSPVASNECPLCHSEISNPSVLVVSGVLFCYPCIHAYALAHLKCPVTMLPLDWHHEPCDRVELVAFNIRRLYDNSPSLLSFNDASVEG